MARPSTGLRLRCSRRRSAGAVLGHDGSDHDAADPVRDHPDDPTTHEVIRANVHRSPMYSGQIKSSGPRYCPSIEDKIVRFGDRDGPQIFLARRARRFHGLSQRHLDLSAGGSSARDPGDHSRTRAGEDGSAGMPSNMITWIPASWSRPCGPGACQVSSWPDRSTATGYEEAAAQGIVAKAERCAGGGRGRSDRVRSCRRLSRRDDRRPRDPWDHGERTGCSPRGPSTV